MDLNLNRKAIVAPWNLLAKIVTLLTAIAVNKYSKKTLPYAGERSFSPGSE
jgi:hypothetical protein